VQLSGVVPQICVLFGPSAAGGAYIPAFCDVVIMRDGNASMYLGSPRMAEMVIGEKVTLEEMGGARMHTGVSGCGHFLVKTDEEASTSPSATCRTSRRTGERAAARAAGGAAASAAPRDRPADENKPFDMQALIDALVDADSFLEVHARWAKELDRRLRAARRARRRHRRQPAEAEGRRAVRRLGRQGRALHLDLQRVQHPAALPRRRPGLHDRHAGRAQGIIRHGAKMISAVSEATVPKSR
jgi:acetyl-CoA carboxylase carboxyltransferase component